jgi:putative oxidoreductase
VEGILDHRCKTVGHHSFKNLLGGDLSEPWRQKLFGWLGGKGLEGTAGFFAGKLGLTPGILWALLAGIAEFGGGLLVLLGLFTRLGALFISTVMLVAIFKVHWGAFFMPTGIEYAVSLFAAAVALLISGGGKFSLDTRLAQK